MLKSSVISVMERMAQDLAVETALLLHSSGQILFSVGPLPESDRPTIAALFVAMASASQSLSTDEKNSLKKIHCEFSENSLYAVSVGKEHWLSVIYQHPLNPGLFRRKVRQYGEILERLSPEFLSGGNATDFPPPNRDLFKENQLLNSRGLAQEHAPTPTGIKMHQGDLAKYAQTPLFENITDDEIDTLFTLGGGEA